ncbi:hypothetical protein RAMLITH_09280 [Ramlibacter sp. RBP-2]|uniref:Uncharacterized protein n=1 Tax=Ramlibacter lithotrophicus TaxID=2606681 RepID=A0A7X6I642_9BURK|nr:hypothetical protein [Ramlibacter lithotrophicus]NKE66011.1 hypothetical protein [Ramlibacter lithotrophicus]
MNPSSKSRSGGREPRDGAKEVDTKNKVSTPDADMQAQDAGTGEGGESGRGRAAEGAMKQQSKMPQERGSRR